MKPAHSSWILALAAAGILAGSLRTGHAQSSPAERATAEALVRGDRFFALAPGADLVVVASPVEAHSRWSADHRLILTDYRLAVASALRGRPPANLDLTVEGGEVGDVGLRVSEAPRFTRGSRYAVLLERQPAGWSVRAGAAGMRLLTTGAATDPVVRDLHLVLRSGVSR